MAGFGDAFHAVDMALQIGLRFGVDNRADVGVQFGGVAHAQFVHRTANHVHHAVGHVFLHAQDTQGGATLAGAVEGGGKYVNAYLLGQRGAVHNHGVLAAGFGDQHRLAAAAGERLVDEAGHFGGAGEHHAVDAFVLREGGTHVARAEHKLQHVARNTGFVHQLHGAVGDQAGLFGGFGHHGVAGSQCGHYFAGEDGQREVPRADGNDGTHALAVFR